MTRHKTNGDRSLSLATSPLRVRTVREQVVDRLRQSILAGRFAAGQRLKEIELAEEFGVSRGPVRDALLQLSKEGVLVYRPNCGVEVAQVAGKPMRELLVALRRTVEEHALRLAFPHFADSDVQDWESILGRLHSACEAEDLAAVVEQDMAFHRWIVEKPGEPDLLALWLPLMMRLRLVYSRHRSLQEVFPEHRRVVRAVRRRDLEAAVKALKENIV